MKIRFNKQYWQAFRRKRLLFHAFLFLYGVLITTVSMTQPTNAYFQQVKTVEGSIQLAAQFETTNEPTGDQDSEKNSDLLNKQAKFDDVTEIGEDEIKSDSDSTAGDDIQDESGHSEAENPIETKSEDHNDTAKKDEDNQNENRKNGEYDETDNEGA